MRQKEKVKEGRKKKKRKEKNSKWGRSYIWCNFMSTSSQVDQSEIN